MPGRQLTDKDKGYIAGAIMRGESQRAIAKHLGVSKTTIANFLRRPGAATTPPDLKETALATAAARKLDLADLLEQGVIAIIRDPLTYSRETIKAWEVNLRNRREWAKIYLLATQGDAAAAGLTPEFHRIEQAIQEGLDANNADAS